MKPDRADVVAESRLVGALGVRWPAGVTGMAAMPV